MTPFLSIFDAYDEMKRLNKVAGFRAYTVTSSVDGYAVRAIRRWSRDFIDWRRDFYRQTLGGDLNEVVP